MVKDKRGRTIRLILGLLVVAVVIAASAAALLASRSGTKTRVPGSAQTAPSTSPSPSPTTTLPATTTSPTAPTTAPAVIGSPRATKAPVKHAPVPLGVRGSWKLVFSESFDGTSLNRNVWNTHNGWTDQNAVSDSSANVTVRNGHAILTLASDSSGAEIGTRHFALKVGEFAQARVKFAGSGQTIYNWPAWWASGPDWPHGGENDIAEGFSALTVNYHSPTITRVTGSVPGDWAGRFHTYGIYRGRTESRVYWDGKLVRTYRTDDDGEPETLLFTLGAGKEIRTGAAGAMVVDYVRAWRPA
jgi:beta-glucanase (GH16 family)